MALFESVPPVPLCPDELSTLSLVENAKRTLPAASAASDAVFATSIPAEESRIVLAWTVPPMVIRFVPFKVTVLEVKLVAWAPVTLTA